MSPRLPLPHALPCLALALCLAALVTGCRADTDQRRYASGDEGLTTFRNQLGVPTYLAGCSAYGFEERDIRGAWSDTVPAVICVWEGYARPVPAHGELTLPLRVPDAPGEYRLHYDVGLGCDPGKPLSEAGCASVQIVHTPPFTVSALCEPQACGPQLGMPNRLCSDGVSVAGPTGRCLAAPDTDLCGWEIATCPEDAR